MTFMTVVIYVFFIDCSGTGLANLSWKMTTKWVWICWSVYFYDVCSWIDQFRTAHWLTKAHECSNTAARELQCIVQCTCVNVYSVLVCDIVVIFV